MIQTPQNQVPFDYFSPSPLSKICVFKYDDEIYQTPIKPQEIALPLHPLPESPVAPPCLSCHSAVKTTVEKRNVSLDQLLRDDVLIEQQSVDNHFRRSSREKHVLENNQLKGLRRLSSTVLALVQKLKSATYGQVADQLMFSFEESREVHNGKKQQNIKRRVYDALNVLQATSVITKKGRKVYPVKNNSRKRQIEIARKKLQSTRLRIKEKRRQISLMLVDSKRKSLKSEDL